MTIYFDLIFFDEGLSFSPNAFFVVANFRLYLRLGLCQGRIQEFSIHGVQTLVQKGLLNLFYGKLLLTETTTCFLICERRSPLAQEILLCEKRRTDQRKRVLSENPWNLV